MRIVIESKLSKLIEITIHVGPSALFKSAASKSYILVHTQAQYREYCASLTLIGHQYKQSGPKGFLCDG